MQFLRCLAAMVLGVFALDFSTRPASAQDAPPELGKQVFLEAAQPPCALCHTLADAEAVGEVGPILDELKPDAERVKAAVVNGIGVMPAYGEILTEEQIEAVAHYVATAVGQAK